MPQNDLRDHRRPTLGHWPPTNTLLYNYTGPIHTSPAFGASRLFCGIPSTLSRYPEKRRRHLSERSTTTVPRSRHSVDRGTLCASNFIRSPRGSIPHQRRRTPSSPQLVSFKAGRHQSPAPPIDLNGPPRPDGVSRFTGAHRIANPTNKRGQSSTRPLAIRGRRKLPPHPITSKKRQSLMERQERHEAPQTASPISQHGQTLKPLTP